MLSNNHIALVKIPRKTTKKSVAVKQEILFEQDLPPLTASVRQTFSGDIFLTMLGIAAILAATALYITRKADIKI